MKIPLTAFWPLFQAVYQPKGKTTMEDATLEIEKLYKSLTTSPGLLISASFEPVVHPPAKPAADGFGSAPYPFPQRIKIERHALLIGDDVTISESRGAPEPA